MKTTSPHTCVTRRIFVAQTFCLPLGVSHHTRLAIHINTMSIFQKAADVAQKGAVLGLMSLLGFQVYQIGANIYETKWSNVATMTKTKNEHAEFMAKISEKVEEESRFKDSIDKIPDRYDRDDDSYLKNVPKVSGKK